MPTIFYLVYHHYKCIQVVNLLLFKMYWPSVKSYYQAYFNPVPVIHTGYEFGRWHIWMPFFSPTVYLKLYPMATAFSSTVCPHAVIKLPPQKY